MYYQAQDQWGFDKPIPKSATQALIEQHETRIPGGNKVGERPKKSQEPILQPRGKDGRFVSGEKKGQKRARVRKSTAAKSTEIRDD